MVARRRAGHGRRSARGVRVRLARLDNLRGERQGSDRSSRGARSHLRRAREELFCAHLCAASREVGSLSGRAARQRPRRVGSGHPDRHRRRRRREGPRSYRFGERDRRGFARVRVHSAEHRHRRRPAKLRTSGPSRRPCQIGDSHTATSRPAARIRRLRRPARGGRVRPPRGGSYAEDQRRGGSGCGRWPDGARDIERRGARGGVRAGTGHPRRTAGLVPAPGRATGARGRHGLPTKPFRRRRRRRARQREGRGRSRSLARLRRAPRHGRRLRGR